MLRSPRPSASFLEEEEEEPAPPPPSPLTHMKTTSAFWGILRRWQRHM